MTKEVNGQFFRHATSKFKHFSRTFKDFQAPSSFLSTFKGLEFQCGKFKHFQGRGGTLIKKDYSIEEMTENKPAAVRNSVVAAVELTPTQDRPSDVSNCCISADKSRALSSVLQHCRSTVPTVPVVTPPAGQTVTTGCHVTGFPALDGPTTHHTKRIAHSPTDPNVWASKCSKLLKNTGIGTPGVKRMLNVIHSFPLQPNSAS